MGGRLEGKVALITGGGIGIGASISKAYIDEGAKVLISGRRKNVLEDFAATMPAGSIEICQGDITKVEDAEAMVEAAVKAFGKLNILVNNAGIDPAGNVVDIPIETWHAIIDTNLNGTFYLTRFSIPKMLEQGGGSVICISSLAGVRAIPQMPAYSSAKAGLVGFTNACTLDFSPQGIRFNIISPGATATDMLKNQMAGLGQAYNTDADGALKLLTRLLPIPRACEPDEIAPLAIFLASDDSAYITGQNFLVDGGATVVDPNGASISALGSTWGG